MPKKSFFLFLSVFCVAILFGCQTPTGTQYALPDLAGLTETEAMVSLTGIPVTIVAKTEENDAVATGMFSRYGDDLVAGDRVSGGAVIKIYFALNYPTLPDLAGKTGTEVRAALDALGLTYVVSVETSNDVPDQTFSRYGSPYAIGSKILDPGSVTITVYIGYNDPVLPDLTGMQKGQIELVMAAALIAYEFEYVTDDAFPEDEFASYQGYEIGDFFPGSRVAIQLYKNTFTTDLTSLIISKYVDGGDDTFNLAIEIYNPTAEAISLGDYHLSIFANGALTATAIIPLENEMLAAGGTYVIVHSAANAEMTAKADLLTDELFFDGNECIQLQYSNGTYIDTIYQLGNKSYVMDNEVFIRNPDIVAGTRTFNLTQWTAYIPTYVEKLGIHPVAKPELLAFVFIDRPFNDVLGGMDLVTLNHVYDGDTVGFDPGYTADKRVRFLGVDTPETYPIVQPWGLEAKTYVTNLMETATRFYLQSDPVSGYTDSFGRTLGLIWVELDGQFFLLNYELIRLGYSQNYLGTDCPLVFENRYLFRWFQDAEKEAIANSRGLHS